MVKICAIVRDCPTRSQVRLYGMMLDYFQLVRIEPSSYYHGITLSKRKQPVVTIVCL